MKTSDRSMPRQRRFGQLLKQKPWVWGSEPDKDRKCTLRGSRDEIWLTMAQTKTTMAKHHNPAIVCGSWKSWRASMVPAGSKISFIYKFVKAVRRLQIRSKKVAHRQQKGCRDVANRLQKVKSLCFRNSVLPPNRLQIYSKWVADMWQIGST